MTAIALPLNPSLGSNEIKSFPKVQQEKVVEIINKVNAISSTDGAMIADSITESTSGAGITVNDTLIVSDGVKISDTVTEYTAETALSAATIIGSDAGHLGHAGGVELVAAAGAGTALQFVNAVLIYDYDTAAYTGGAGDDLTVYINSVAVSGAIATADLITKAGDTVINLSSLTSDYVMGVNSNINLACTTVTNPGTAAGVIRAKVTYRVVTTGL